MCIRWIKEINIDIIVKCLLLQNTIKGIKRRKGSGIDTRYRGSFEKLCKLNSRRELKLVLKGDGVGRNAEGRKIKV